MKKSGSSPFPFDGKIRKAIIIALVVDTKSCNWPIEMKMTKSLLTQYPDPDFWFFLSKNYKFQTLMSLLAQKNIIFSQHLEYTKQKNLELKTFPTVKLEDKKIGEDIIIRQPEQTLLGFIK
jgi:hypothetical protein